jgi:hypothetical protein
MKFKEAKKAIKEGKKLKCKYWTFDGKFIDSLGMIAFSVSIFKLYNDWEIIE